jgi:hypothetical protein
MKPYNMDQSLLRNSKTKEIIGMVDNSKVKDRHGNTLARFNRVWIFDASSNRIAHFDGTDVKDKSGVRITTIDKIRQEIDGPGGISIVALWVIFLR